MKLLIAHCSSVVCSFIFFLKHSRKQKTSIGTGTVLESEAGIQAAKG
jgi:hypothetical protein